MKRTPTYSYDSECWYSHTLLRLSMTLLSIAFMAKYSPVFNNSTKCTLQVHMVYYLKLLMTRELNVILFQIKYDRIYLPVSPDPKGFTGLKCFKSMFSPPSRTYKRSNMIIAEKMLYVCLQRSPGLRNIEIQ
jgi:hypothetical protein